MYIFLLSLLVLDGIFLGVVILLQAGKGGGLAAMGGGAAASDVLGGKRATTVLIRATWAGGALFMVLSLVLAIMSSRSRQPQSILEQDVQETQQAPEPLLPGAQDPPGQQGGGEKGGGAIPIPEETGGGSSGSEGSGG